MNAGTEIPARPFPVRIVADGIVEEMKRMVLTAVFEYVLTGSGQRETDFATIAGTGDPNPASGRGAQRESAACRDQDLFGGG